jgi:hypothetical protein
MSAEWKLPKLAAAALAAAWALTAFGSGEARAQNVKNFSCTTSSSVAVDVSGLGNTNVCVLGAVDLGLFCACVSNSGNCPNDQKKQTVPTTVSADVTVQPKNGRVRATFGLPLPGPIDDEDCTAGNNVLSCPGGQDPELVGFQTTSAADFTLCLTTDQPGGAPCTCDTGEPDLATATCTPAGQTTFFPGTSQDCQALFP